MNNPQGILRLKKLLKNLKAFSGHKFRYQNPKIRIVRGAKDEPNAYSLGPTIYVTQSALAVLDDRELTAVLAHEVAHSEYGHLLERMVFVLGSSVSYPS